MQEALERLETHSTRLQADFGALAQACSHTHAHTQLLKSQLEAQRQANQTLATQSAQAAQTALECDALRVQLLEVQSELAATKAKLEVACPELPPVPVSDLPLDKAHLQSL